MTNDLISREAVLEILMKYCPDDDGSCSKADIDPREMLDEIESLPAVDAAPVVHSKWVWIPDEEEDNTWHLVCDACRHGGLFEDDNCCPNCGARMDKEADNAQK